MRLLLVGNFLSASGKGVAYCEEFAVRLRGRGHSVVTTSFSPGRARRLIDMVATATRRRRDYDVAQVDVYSGLGFTWAEAVSLVLARLGKPAVFTLHGGALPGFARDRPARISRFLARARIVTAPSRYLQEALRPYRGDIRHVPNAIAVDRYRFIERSAPRPTLLWLRAFHDVYDPGAAVRAFPAIVKAFPDARLTLIGPDKGDGTRKATEALAAELCVGDRVSILDGVSRDRVPDVLAEADVFVNTARVDNAPVSVLEAMACGMCVVSTNVGGIPYLATDGQDALLVKHGDPAAVADGVVRVLSDRELAGRLSRNARRTACRFDWPTVLPLWDSLLAEAAGQDVAAANAPGSDRR